MSRELKFRSWCPLDEGNGIMNSGITIRDMPDTQEAFDDRCIWMQFTGCLDSRGREIYEGDILDVSSPDYDIYYTGEVVWHDDAEGFRLVEPGRIAYIKGHSDQLKVTVIGNIHEHPGLIDHK